MWGKFPKRSPSGKPAASIGERQRDLLISDFRFYVWRVRRSRLRAELHARIANRVASMMRTGWVVDVGCGPGLLKPHMDSLMKNVRMVGVDIDRRMLAFARTEFGLEVVQGASSNLPIRDEGATMVVSSASIKDWGNPEQGLAEIVRVVKPGGRALIYEFVTKGPASQPKGFALRYGLVSDLLRRMMASLIQFTVDDAHRLARTLKGDVEADVGVETDIGVVRIEIEKHARTPPVVSTSGGMQ